MKKVNLWQIPETQVLPPKTLLDSLVLACSFKSPNIFVVLVGAFGVWLLSGVVLIGHRKYSYDLPARSSSCMKLWAPRVTSFLRTRWDLRPGFQILWLDGRSRSKSGGTSTSKYSSNGFRHFFDTPAEHDLQCKCALEWPYSTWFLYRCRMSLQGVYTTCPRGILSLVSLSKTLPKTRFLGHLLPASCTSAYGEN